MGFSPLADMKRRIPDVGRSSPRLYAVSGVGVHYQYGKNIHTEATNPAREVSANYWIDDDGTIRPNIDESRRAWTSGDPAYPAGALADHRNITVEVSCIGSGTDRISAAALAALSRLIGDVYRRYKLGPVKRGAGKGVGVHRDWVATACPGNYMMDRMPGVITSAEQFRVGGAGSGSTGDEEMTPAQMKELKQYIDQRTRIAGSPQIVKNGDGHWLEVGTGRVGIWGRDLSAIRSAIVALNWQRRDGAGPKGKSDVAYATGGPGPHAYNIFNAYRRAAVEGRQIKSPLVKKVTVKGGAAGGSAALAHIDDVAPGLADAPATVDVFEVDESTEEG